MVKEHELELVTPETVDIDAVEHVMNLTATLFTIAMMDDPDSEETANLKMMYQYLDAFREEYHKD